MYVFFFKRLFDFIAALILLIVLSPFIILIIIFLALMNNGKPFFFQKRPGKDEKVFSIIKFKTMNDKTDTEGNLLPDKDRLTHIGKFVRKTSFDEIPQLINVLKGEMSFIGPRPLLIRYLPYYSDEERIRHSVKPGITGLAQISGRNLLNWDERLSKDVFYVKNLTFTQDFKIVISTFNKVIRAKDVAVDTNTVMQDLDAYRS